MERSRTANLSREEAIPYFLWDEDTSIAELRQVLREGPEHLRAHYTAKILREARPEHAGYPTQEWWRQALRKEAGITPEILAHQVSVVAMDTPWPRLAVPLERPQLRAYRDGLARDLARQAFPGSATP